MTRTASIKTAIVRFFRPMILAHLSYQAKHSQSEVQRLADLRNQCIRGIAAQHERQEEIRNLIEQVEQA